MANVLKKDPFPFGSTKEEFLKALKDFHAARGTPISHLPRISGKEIDLHHLYALVVARGGWERVNSRNEWGSLLPEFGQELETVNAAVALKHIYLRYLDHYERLHFLGEDLDRSRDGDEDGARAKRRLTYAQQVVPLTYNAQQHNMSETVRQMTELSQTVYHASDYDRLGLSLLSPLPNERDFALNVCTLLANEGKYSMQLEKCPQVLDYLLFHAGIFRDEGFRILQEEYWKEQRTLNLIRFWKEVIQKQGVKDLVLDHFLGKPAEEEEECLLSPSRDSVATEDDPEIVAISCEGQEGSASNICDIDEDGCDSDYELFTLGRCLGVLDKEGQRVTQIASILRNISFEERNAKIMAAAVPCLRFILACLSSNYGSLPQLAWDTLGNLSQELQLSNVQLKPVFVSYLSYISDTIMSRRDRGRLLAALETLSKLSSQDQNEEFLISLLRNEVYDSVCSLLTVPDIHLLIMTLECLYALSGMGNQPCQVISYSGNAISVLLSLLTIEAQSYGSQACIHMRVVENTMEVDIPPDVANVPSVHIEESAKVARAAIVDQSEREKEAFAVQWLKKVYVIDLNCSVEQDDLYKGYLQAVSQHFVGQKKSFLYASGFAHCVRVAFGAQVGPLQRPRPGGGIDFIYKGLVKRPPTMITPTTVSSSPPPMSMTPPPLMGPRAVAVSLSPTPANQETPISPILKAQLSCPPKGSSHSTSLTPSTPLSQSLALPSNHNQVMAHPHLSQALLGSISGPKVPTLGHQSHAETPRKAPDLSGSSSLIKSLLASKVNQNLQRQQQQQQQQQQSLSQEPAILSVALKQGGTHGGSHTEGDVNEKGSVEGGSKVKGLLAEMLEKKIAKDPGTLNGLVEKEIRISEKGLEVVGKKANHLVNGEDFSMTHGTKRPSVDESTQSWKKPRLNAVTHDSNSNGLQKEIDGNTTACSHGLHCDDKPERGSTCNDGIHCGKEDQDQINCSAQGSTRTNTDMCSEMSKANNSGEKCPDGIHCGEEKSLSRINCTDGVHGGAGAKEEFPKSAGKCEDGIHCGTDDEDEAETKPNPAPSSASSAKISSSNTAAGRKKIVLPHVCLNPETCGEPECMEAFLDPPTSAASTPKPQPEAIVTSSGPTSTMISSTSLIVNQTPGSQSQLLVVKQGNQQYHYVVRQPMIVQQSGGPGSSQLVLTSTNQTGSTGSASPQQSALLVSQGQPGHMKTAILLVPQQTGAGGSNAQRMNASPITITAHPSVISITPSSGDSQSQQQQHHMPSSAIVTGTVIQQKPATATTVTVNSGPASNLRTHAITRAAAQANEVQKGTLNVTTMMSSAAKTMKPTVSQKPTVTITSGPANAPTTSASQASSKHVPKDVYLCEWRGCLAGFKKASSVYIHACETHVPQNAEELPCLWDRCDGTKRKKLSLMTHLLDRHCNEQVLKLNLVRRRQLALTGKTTVPEPPKPSPHPGYAPNAAYQAIRRHALDALAALDKQEEKEGPVTKSIRLTSALILRNLGLYSDHGRRILKMHEPELLSVATSAMEASRTVAQILHDLHQTDSR